jgi:hypothetical protein
MRPGLPVTFHHAGDLIDGISSGPLFTKGAPDPRLNPARIIRQPGDDDPYALLREMRFQGSRPINQTQLIATKTLLHDGLTLLRTVQIVLRATKDAVRGDPRCADWDWWKEEEQIADMCYRAITRYPSLHPALPDVLYAGWRAHQRLHLHRANGIGWTVTDTPEETPPPVAVLDEWLRRITDDASVSDSAVRYANSIFLDAAIRTAGYVQVTAKHTAGKLHMPQRTVERARQLLIKRGYLRRVPGGGRAARLMVEHRHQWRSME